MATRRLYHDDSYMETFDARVQSCLPVQPMVTETGSIPVWEVVLDRTAFYPSSGGQPNDVGQLGDARVLDVREGGEDILHLVDREMETGPVQGIIHWPRRFDHMQQHTGQHLLSAMFQGRYGLPTVSFHLGAELCTVDLRGPAPSADVLLGAQRAANGIIFEDRAVILRYLTADQLARLGIRKQVDREGILRVIEIAEADLQPCGGTHVKSTGQIGLLLLRRCTKIRQDYRVEFVCGGRAERMATADLQLLRSVSERLSCAPEEIPAATEKAVAERDENFKLLRNTLQQLAEARAALLLAARPAQAAGWRIVVEILRGAHPELLQLLATELVKNERTIALLASEETGQIVFAQSLGGRKDLAALLKHVLAICSGKGGGTRDFVRAKLTDAGNAAQVVGLARRLLED